MPKLPKKERTRAHRLGTILLQLESITALDNTRYREKLAESARYRHRTRPRPAAAVWRRKRLVQVQVQHIDAHRAGLGNTHERIEIGTVEINHPALGMNDLGDCLDVGLEQTERIGFVIITAATVSSIAFSTVTASITPRSSEEI